MAERSSGRYSPAPAEAAGPPTRPAGPGRAEPRTGWLCAAALPFAARRSARRPAFRRRIAGAALTGLGLFPGARGGSGLGAPLLPGGIGAALHHLAFGADPLRGKGLAGIDPHQQDRVARILAEGEGYPAAIHAAARRTRDAAIVARVESFAGTARTLFATVEQDPGDLTAARRWLGAHLIGARDATARFAGLWAKTHDPAARADYEALLHDLQRNFARRTATLPADDRSDLDIEIGVLRDRPRRERLHPPDDPPESDDVQHP